MSNYFKIKGEQSSHCNEKWFVAGRAESPPVPRRRSRSAHSARQKTNVITRLNEFGLHPNVGHAVIQLLTPAEAEKGGGRVTLKQLPFQASR